jgi:hypothetical protein
LKSLLLAANKYKCDEVAKTAIYWPRWLRESEDGPRLDPSS